MLSDLALKDEAITEDAEIEALAFEKVTIRVPKIGGNCLPKESCAPCRAFLNEWIPLESREGFATAQEVSGYLKRSEVVLLLGAAGSGRSSLLRALCGRLNKKDEMLGTVWYKGESVPRDSEKWASLATFVSSTDNSHSPVLTVEETFRFAAHCTNNRGKESNSQEEVQKMLEMLELTNVANTVVGDENIRGVSGGQKRRVTVGEMLLNQETPFLLLDDITRGLDSVSSLSLLTNIRQLCKKGNYAAMIALDTPSDALVQLADRILVLAQDGSMAYFGSPADRANLSHVFGDSIETQKRPLVEILLSACIGERAPDLALRFCETAAYKELEQSLATMKTLSCEASTQSQAFPQKNAMGLLRTLSDRQRRLILRNKMTTARIFIAIVFGVIVGSLFQTLSNDLIGALGRTGFLFLSIFLVLMLSSAVTLPDNFRQRNTFYKQRSASFYPTWIYYLSQTAMDLPLSFVEATLLSVIPYFWIGLKPGAGPYFYFLFALFGMECVGQALARLLSAVAATQVLASIITTSIIFVWGSLAGFMPTYPRIGWWFRWISFLNPAAYAFEGIMMNNFEGTEMYALSFTAPNGGDISIQQMGGDDYLGIQGLPRVSWGTTSQIMALDMAMLYIFALVLNLLSILMAEKGRIWYSDLTRRTMTYLPPPRIGSEETMLELSESDKEDEMVGENSTADRVWKPEALMIQNLSYSVRIGSSPLLRNLGRSDSASVGSIVLLESITAVFSAGRMTALMGKSGAGKTTLMDVIAGMKTNGTVEGGIYVDGLPKRESWFRQISAYAEQNDILNPFLSVEETVMFTVFCRSNKSEEEKLKVVADSLELVGLSNKLTVLVGKEDRGEGLAKHERKRLTIASALSQEPRILFLDEPTSGLGTLAALQLMHSVRKATTNLNLITLITIHQPGATIFGMFDDILLLAQGGRTAYSGAIGKHCSEVSAFFAEQVVAENNTPSAHEDPSEWFLSLVQARNEETVAHFKASSRSSQIEDRVRDLIGKGQGGEEIPFQKNSGLGAWQKLKVLTKRQFLSQWRNPSFSMVRLWTSFWGCLYIGLLFLNLGNTIQGAVFSIAAIFYMVFTLVVPMQAAIVPLIEERAVVYRETVSGTYPRLLYGASQLLADIPFHIVNAVLYLILYGLVGFRTGAEYVGYFLLCMVLLNWIIPSLGQLFAFASPNEETAVGLAGLSILLSVILMGFLVTVTAMPDGWTWAYWSNLLHYSLQGLVTNELSGQNYTLPISIPAFFNESDSSLAVVFQPGIVPSESNPAGQALRLTQLSQRAFMSGPLLGNSNTTLPLLNLMRCFIENDCLEAPLETNIFRCAIFNFPRPPPCADEFNAARSEIFEVARCFINTTNPSEMNTEEKIDLILCILRALLPPAWIQFLTWLIEVLFGLVMFIRDIFKYGIDGNLILLYFGWAKLSLSGEVGDIEIQTFKWFYCMVSIVVFLAGIEILKLFAIRYIVWMKR